MEVKLPFYDIKNVKQSDLSVDSFVFDVDNINNHLLYQSVISYLARKRSGTAAAKTRSEVRGGGAKPWKQKGTGRARAGTKSSPLWNGGGVIFPPKLRDYSKGVTKKEKKTSLRMAFTVKRENIFIFEGLYLDKPSTKGFSNILKEMNINSSLLLIINDKDSVLFKSVRNLKNVKVVLVTNVNVFDLIKYEKVGILKSALKELVDYCK